MLGENPLRITYIFEKIKQFGGHARQAGGVVAIEEALWDIAGKVYGVPIYQMLGGKFRDKVRIYADTEESDDVDGVRQAPEDSQGRNGPHVAQNGPGHQHGREDPRNSDHALRQRPLGSATSCRISSPRPR